MKYQKIWIIIKEVVFIRFCHVFGVCSTLWVDPVQPPTGGALRTEPHSSDPSVGQSGSSCNVSVRFYHSFLYFSCYNVFIVSNVREENRHRAHWCLLMMTSPLSHHPSTTRPVRSSLSGTLNPNCPRLQEEKSPFLPQLRRKAESWTSLEQKASSSFHLQCSRMTSLVESFLFSLNHLNNRLCYCF